MFAGPRDDGFYVDLGGVFDLANLRPKGMAQDGVSGYNTHSIVLEIPTTQLTADGQRARQLAEQRHHLGVWARPAAARSRCASKGIRRRHPLRSVGSRCRASVSR